MQEQAHTFVEIGHDEASQHYLPGAVTQLNVSPLDENAWRMQFPDVF